MRVLVIDDSAFARKRIRQVFEGAGYEVVEAEGGEAALAACAQSLPDLATVDLLMPDMDGMALIGRLRAQYPPFCIIALSADVQRATRDQVMAAGASAFVSKTAPPQELIEVAQALLGQPLPSSIALELRDTLVKLMNAAMGQAAYALGTLLNKLVTLNVPEIKIFSATALPVFLQGQVETVGVAVEQRFSGEVPGLAALVIPDDDAVKLVRVLLDRTSEIAALSAVEQSVLAEVGNVIINAAVATVGDRLGTRLMLSLPQVYLDMPAREMSRALMEGAVRPLQVIVLVSWMVVGTVDVRTFLLLLLPSEGLQRLADGLAV